ncbi:protein PIN-LIKES 7 [Brachypodium distachyon]|uniref:Auxin efflux carrier family protein n=1 Tax=Brachypodium distachyon TaxID=15368 RepID=I1IFS8_BRADI|nr:protein PIN-LIKES 7 [Brachypodium distachyon]PNT69745.1 hypothetical protein BRADI_3g60740v3 [Brachypodium distachyon]|eukprot:XP_003573172.1 protein PIN-LIKES 7 [Brachypodium distachyon]
MGFVSLLLVASSPVVEVLLIAVLGAYLASGHGHKVLLGASARTDINRVVYAVFTPALMLSSLARTVTLRDAVSWWFMPVNIGIIFLAGGLLGWAAVFLLRPPQHLRGLVVASCSAANFGNLLLIMIPAVCREEGNPFAEDGGAGVCTDRGLSYASFSMALGGLYIWTHTYSVMKRSSEIYRKMNHESTLASAVAHHGHDEAAHDDPKKDSLRQEEEEEEDNQLEEPSWNDDEEEGLVSQPSSDSFVVLDHEREQRQALLMPLVSSYHLQHSGGNKISVWDKLKHGTHQILEELTAPPTVSAVLGFSVGAVPWLRSAFIGDGAPLRVVQDALKILGDGTIPCITLILGGNLTKGVRKTAVSRWIIAAIIGIRYVALPLIGVAAVKSARELGFLPPDPLYQYVLMLQFALPPAMSIGTMAQLYDVAQEECSVIFLWTYLVAALALTLWSTIFMSILS